MEDKKLGEVIRKHQRACFKELRELGYRGILKMNFEPIGNGHIEKQLQNQEI